MDQCRECSALRAGRYTGSTLLRAKLPGLLALELAPARVSRWTLRSLQMWMPSAYSSIQQSCNEENR
jgi:hypothetical protein